MNRQQAKKLLPMIQAFIEGKEIEYRSKGDNEKWREMNDMPGLSYVDAYEYRIKPEPKYRPFANAEECWQEMQKHQPFGWVKDNEKENYAFITVIRNDSKIGEISVGGNTYMNLSELMDNCTFADGTPFGIKEE